MARSVAVTAALAVAGCVAPRASAPPILAGSPAPTPPPETVDRDSPPRPASWGALVGNVSLDDWITKSITQHPALRTARAGTELARSRVRAARAARRPVLDMELDFRAGERGGSAEDTGGNLARSATRAQGSWELDPFGRIRTAVGAARYAEVAADYERRDLELAIAAELATTYVSALLESDRLAIRKEMVAACAEIERYNRNRLKTGLTNERTLERSRAQRLEAERAQAAAARSLAVLAEEWKALVPTNQVPDLFSIESTPLPPLPEAPKQDRLHAYVVNRPDVTVANSLLQSAEHRATAASRSRLPTVAAVASAEGTGPSPIDEPEEWTAWAGVRVTLPVLAPGTTAEVAMERARTNRAEAELADAIRLALFEVRRAYVQRVHAEREWHSARARADELEASLTSVERRREQGLVSIAEVAQARLAWLAADEKARILHAEVLRFHLSLIRACGGPMR